MSHLPHPSVPQGYAEPPPPALRPRPGLVTAVGVGSIIVASLSLIGCLAYGVYVFGVRQVGMFAAGRAQSVGLAAGAVPPAGPLGATVPTPEEVEGRARKDRQRLADRRDALVQLLNGVHEMAPTQQAQLAAMLGRHAGRMVPPDFFAPGERSVDDVRAWVARAGAQRPERPGDPEPVYFELKAGGRLEVFADRAVFRPGDGTANLRTAARDGTVVEGLRFTLAADGQDSTTAPGGGGAAGKSGGSIGTDPPAGPTTRGVGPFYRSGLNRQQVDQIVAGVQGAAQSTPGGGPLNPAQLATLRAELQNHPLVTPQKAYLPTQGVATMPDGTVHLALSDGTLQLGPDGTVRGRTVNAFHKVTTDPVAGTLAVGDLAASGLAAVLLLAAGILVLRNSPRGAGLLWVYALVKLPLAVLGAAAFAWVLTDLTGSISRMSGGQGWAGGSAALGVMMGAAAAAYPVVLMIVLSTRTVREFYAAERSGRG